MLGAFLVLTCVVIAIGLYLWQIQRSRSYMESLHEGPEDMRRADDNQPPPQDGSAGFV